MLLFRPGIATLVLALAAGCSAPPPEAPAPEAEQSGPTTDVVLTGERQRAAGIEVVAARTETWPEQIEAPAVIALDGRRTARVGSLIEGVVGEVERDVGDAVTTNARLTEIHSHVTHVGWADLRKARAGLTRLSSELDFAKRAHERTVRLLADKAIGAQEVERAALQVQSVEQEIVGARAELKRAEQELQHIGIDPHRAEGQAEDVIPVRTPQRGVVIERLVTPGTTVTPGQPLFVVSDLSTLWALAEVDEVHLGLLRTGGQVDLRVAAYPDDTFRAVVLAVGDLIDPHSRRVQVRCEVPNPDRRLKPEMFATVRLTTASHDTVTVPREAVQNADTGTVVYIEVEPGRFRPRAVRLGESRGDRVAIAEGLSAGERVVGKGAFLIKSEAGLASMPESD